MIRSATDCQLASNVIQTAIGGSNRALTVHDLPLEVGARVVLSLCSGQALASAVVEVLTGACGERPFFQPPRSIPLPRMHGAVLAVVLWASGERKVVCGGHARVPRRGLVAPWILAPAPTPSGRGEGTILRAPLAVIRGFLAFPRNVLIYG